MDIGTLTDFRVEINVIYLKAEVQKVEVIRTFEIILKRPFDKKCPCSARNISAYGTFNGNFSTILNLLNRSIIFSRCIFYLGGLNINLILYPLTFDRTFHVCTIVLNGIFISIY